MKWIVVADAAKARVLSAEKLNESWSEVTEMLHPESRQKIGELYRDDPSVMSSSSGPGQDVIEPATDLKDKETQTFAREVSDFLEENHLKENFDQLYVMAAPAFLGMLRPLLHKGVEEKIVTSIDKNLVDMDIDTLKGYLT